MLGECKIQNKWNECVVCVWGVGCGVWGVGCGVWGVGLDLDLDLDLDSPFKKKHAQIH
ncbi:hypothetical protein AOR02nite_23360 [Acetobacter orientalis]|nr:hypothetical protein AOR02nite_23360 [Acetobacter orientalis]